MAALLRPFNGYVPAPEFAPRVVGPPVAMLSPDQREAARVDPLSFRHVVGKGAGTSVDEAERWIRSCNAEGVLQPVGPAIVIYQVASGGVVATGLIAEVSLDAYDNGRVKRHEDTLERTEQKMVKYMETTRIYGNPVALAHRHDPRVDDVIAASVTGDPHLAFAAADGSQHKLWVVDPQTSSAVCGWFSDELYITDGHHRLAAAASVARGEGRAASYLPAGVFPPEELQLRSFARCVADPDLDTERVIDQLQAEHDLVEVAATDVRPTRPLEFGVKLAGRCYRLLLDPDRVPSDLYQSLDVNLLQSLILEPVLGIRDPRADARLHFVPDQPHVVHDELGCGAWFMPFPPTIDAVMAVADPGRSMPPKSTLFTPKLPSGLVVRRLDAG